jgi:hypothetical protein
MTLSPNNSEPETDAEHKMPDADKSHTTTVLGVDFVDFSKQPTPQKVVPLQKEEDGTKAAVRPPRREPQLNWLIVVILVLQSIGLVVTIIISRTSQSQPAQTRTSVPGTTGENPATEVAREAVIGTRSEVLVEIERRSKEAEQKVADEQVNYDKLAEASKKLAEDSKKLALDSKKLAQKNDKLVQANKVEQRHYDDLKAQVDSKLLENKALDRQILTAQNRLKEIKWETAHAGGNSKELRRLRRENAQLRGELAGYKNKKTKNDVLVKNLRSQIPSWASNVNDGGRNRRGGRKG